MSYESLRICFLLLSDRPIRGTASVIWSKIEVGAEMRCGCPYLTFGEKCKQERSQNVNFSFEHKAASCAAVRRTR